MMTGAFLVFIALVYWIEEQNKRINRLENRVWDLEEKLHLHDHDDI